MPGLAVTLDRASAEELFQLDAQRIMQADGAVMLGMARENRFVLVINEGEDSEAFEYEKSVALAQGQAMFAGAGPTEDDAAVVRKAYPKAFLAWLYNYCQGQPDISEAWLALVSIDGKGKPGVCVLFDDAAADSHALQVKQQAHLLQPGRMLLDRTPLERDGQMVTICRSRSACFSRFTSVPINRAGGRGCSDDASRHRRSGRISICANKRGAGTRAGAGRGR